MKVNSVPEGFDKVLQFNVYMKNGEQRDPRTDIRYTVKDDYKNPRPVRDSHDRLIGEPRGNRNISRDRPIEELTPDDVGDIRSFLNRVKSDAGDDDIRRSKDQPHFNTVEESMFKPRDRDRLNEYGERTQEKTPQGPMPQKKVRGSPENEEYFLREASQRPDNRPSELSADDIYQQDHEDAENISREPQEHAERRDDGRYLEIFVRPKGGQERLVYREDGEPAEVVHRFTPKKNYDRYNQEPDQISDQKSYPDEQNYRKEFRNPELRMPQSNHKKYVPKYEEEKPYLGSTNKKRSVPKSDYEQDHQPAAYDRKPVKYSQEKPRLEEPEIYPMHRIDPDEAYARNSRVSNPKYYPTTDEPQQISAYQPRPKTLYPVEAYDRPEKNTRGRYPDDLVDDQPENDYEPMDEQERRKYQLRQKELIQALYDEKNALKELVDRLCTRLDNDEANQQPEYEVEVRPREEYVNVPPRKSKSPSPRPYWQDGPYKNAPERGDALSKQRRKSPFDVDPSRGKTEWEVKEPYLKQYDKLGRTPERKSRVEPYDEPSPNYNERPRTPNRHERTAPSKIQTYSPVRESPKAGDEFCGLCDVYVDKEKYKRDKAANTSPKQSQPRNQSQYREPRANNGPSTYYVQGKIIGKLDRPSYIRDLFQPSYLG